MNTITIHFDTLIRYPSGAEARVAAYKETWNETPYHCPACGAQGVYAEPGEGDPCEGPQFICSMCGVMFAMPSISEPTDMSRDRGRMIHEAAMEALARRLAAEYARKDKEQP
jgi:ribosomal protein L37AE/L43A